MKNPAIILTLLFLALSCGGRKVTTVQTTSAAKQSFNADSAFSYIKAQTDFGPRVPNTQAHEECATWLAAKLSSFGAQMHIQKYVAQTFDNKNLTCTNIIGRINPDNATRIIICSHWDSRPWADNDPDPSNWKKPVDAANDGASGVGVILEIARQLQKQAPSIGVDLIFFDAEDWGPGPDFTGQHLESYWGLGTQYWAREKLKSSYRARYAILLDMVGGKGARFSREMYSVMFGKNVVDKVWNTAAQLGYSSLFRQEDGGYITDDHFFINTIARIPAIDIVPYVPECESSSFGPTWHTTHDNIDNIDKKVLEAVGKTLLTVIYNEQP